MGIVYKEKFCLVCEKIFKPASARQLFCGHECYLKSKRKNRNVVCIICFKNFEPNSPCQKTCSKECRKINNRNIQRKSEEKGKNIEKFCEFCNSKYLTDREESRFCSLRCVHNSHIEDRIIIKCKECDKDIEVIFGNPKERKFCSYDCAYKNKERRSKLVGAKKLKGTKRKKEYILKTIENRRKNGKPWVSDEQKKIMSKNAKNRLRIKKNHPNWKGGVTKLNKLIRSMEEYKIWRKHILNRDNISCVDCGNKFVDGFEIHVHHIISFKKILKKNKIKTIEQAKECKELWNLDNGKCLCYECHCKIHLWMTNKKKRNK